MRVVKTVIKSFDQAYTYSTKIFYFWKYLRLKYSLQHSLHIDPFRIQLFAIN